MKILVIDDNLTILSSSKKVLTLLGHHVLTATNGEAGLVLALSEQPDRIFCDYEMPGLDGTEVYERMPEELRERMWLWSGSVKPDYPRPERIIAKPCHVHELLRRAGVETP